MSELLQISQLGHPVLRKKAKLVKNIADKELQRLIDDMIATVIDANGAGIAAPQVYQSHRVFIISSSPSSRYPDDPEIAPMAVINPKIVSHGKEIESEWEGCLSIPGIRGLTPRWKKIKVTYSTRDGKKVSVNYENFLARVFQHELDHLDGMVFLDRLASNKDICTEKEYQKIVSKRKAKSKKV